MLKLTITYHLNTEGINNFDGFYCSLVEAISKREGFHAINQKTNENIVKLTVCFDSQEHLTKWASSSEHGNLKEKMEGYISQPATATKEIVDFIGKGDITMPESNSA